MIGIWYEYFLCIFFFSHIIHLSVYIRSAYLLIATTAPKMSPQIPRVNACVSCRNVSASKQDYIRFSNPTHHSVFYYIDSNRIEQGCLGCCQMHCNNTGDRQYQFACIYRDKWSEFLFSSADVNLIDCNVCDILWIYFHYVTVFERNRWKIKKIRFSMLLMKDE